MSAQKNDPQAATELRTIEIVRRSVPQEATIEVVTGIEFRTCLVLGRPGGGFVTLLCGLREFAPGWTNGGRHPRDTWMDIPVRGEIYTGRGWLEKLAKNAWTALEKARA